MNTNPAQGLTPTLQAVREVVLNGATGTAQSAARPESPMHSLQEPEQGPRSVTTPMQAVWGSHPILCAAQMLRAAAASCLPPQIDVPSA